jgi:20S proteasome alpha/beta subunit
VVAASSTSPSSTTAAASSYTSVRALDQFGHSIQLKHAREAAHRHGRLVVAAACQNKKKNGEPTNGGTVVVVSLGNRPMVHSITLPMTSSSDNSNNNNSGMLALCCTGVKGDVNWLVMQVQQHVAKIWERYNHHPISASSMAHFVARLLGSFNGEDADQEWQSSLRRSSSESSDTNDSWARPLGIQTLLLSTKEDPYILMIEPSGRVLTTKQKKSNEDAASSSSWWCAAMGKDSDAVNAKVQRNRKEIVDLDSLDACQLKEKLVQLLLDTTSVSSSSSRKNDIIEFMVEILTSSGIERRVIQYQNGKEVASIPHPLPLA